MFITRCVSCCFFFFFSSRRRHTRFDCDWSSDVCSSDLGFLPGFAYQCGVFLAGYIGYAEARVAEHLNYAWAMALVAATVFVLGAVVALLGPERRGGAVGRRGGKHNRPRWAGRCCRGGGESGRGGRPGGPH